MLPSDQEQSGPQLSGGSGVPPASAPDDLAFELAASWVSPSIARGRLDAWLRSHRWPAAQREDMVLALSEAVSNSIEHGYGVHEDDLPTADTVTVAAAVTTDGPRRRVVLTVHDDGTWIPPGPPSHHRGHGLSVMRACGDGLEIDHDGRGTTVTLTSRAAAALSRPGSTPSSR